MYKKETRDFKVRTVKTLGYDSKPKEVYLPSQYPLACMAVFISKRQKSSSTKYCSCVSFCNALDNYRMIGAMEKVALNKSVSIYPIIHD